MFLDKRYFFLCFFFVLYNFYDTSWFRQIGDTQDLYGLSSRSGSDILSFPVLHPSDLSCGIVSYDNISYFERSCHHDDGGNDSLFRIRVSIYDDTDSRSIRIIFQIEHFSLKKNCFKKLWYALSCLGRNSDHRGIASPVFWSKSIFSKILFDSIKIFSWFIDYN